jgi:hypothetical protein
MPDWTVATPGIWGEAFEQEPVEAVELGTATLTR